MAADIIMSGQHNKQRVGLLDMILSGAIGFAVFISKAKTAISIRSLAKKLDKLVNPSLSGVIDLTNDQMKSKMAASGMTVNKDTDTAIENMRAYLSGLREQEREDILKSLKLNDINRFADMVTTLKWLDKKALTGLSDEERYVLSQLKGKGQTTIDDIRGILKGAHENGRFSEVSEDEMIKTAFKLIYPTHDAEALVSRYHAAADEVRLSVTGSMKLGEIVDDSNFKIQGEEVLTTEEFAKKYKSLLLDSTVEQTEEFEWDRAKLTEELMKELGLILYGKEIGELSDKEKDKITDKINAIINIGVRNKYSSEEKRQEQLNKYLGEIGITTAQEIRYIYDLTQLVRTGYADIMKEYEANGIDYGQIKKNKRQLTEYIEGILSGQGVSEDKVKAQAEKIVGTMKLADFDQSEEKFKVFSDQLARAVKEGLIKIEANTTRAGIIGQIKSITNKQLRKTGLGVKEISSLLKMAELDIWYIEYNMETINEWMSESEIVKEYGKKVMFDYEQTMEQLTDKNYTRTLYSKKASKVIKEQYENKTYEELLDGEDGFGGLSEGERVDFFKLIGLDYERMMKNYGKLETVAAESIAEKAMTIKEQNETVKKVMDKFSVKELSNSEYITAVGILISKGVISAEELIRNNSAISVILKQKTVGKIKEVFGAEFEGKMEVLGLSEAFNNLNKLTEKYKGETERAVISSMAISELTNVEELLKEGKEGTEAMAKKIEALGKTVTMKEVKEIAQREGLQFIGEIVNELLGTTKGILGAYSSYENTKRRLVELGISDEVLENMTIKSIVDDKEMVVIVKVQKDSGMKIEKIEKILKNEGSRKQEVSKYLKGLSIKEMEEAVKGLSESGRESLYGYIGIDYARVTKNKAAIIKSSKMPERLAEEYAEGLSVSDLDNKGKVKEIKKKIDAEIKKKYYDSVTLEQYEGYSEQEKAKYGADAGIIAGNAEELAIGSEDDLVIKAKIVGSMKISEIMDKKTAEKKVKKIMSSEAVVNKYYKMMDYEEFMAATEVTTEGTYAKNNKATIEKREAILGSEGYANLRKNYENLSRAARFGEGVKGVSAAVLSLSEEEAYNSIKAVATEGQLTEEQAKVVTAIKKPVVKKTITPAVKKAEQGIVVAGEKSFVRNCADVAIDTIGKIIPLRQLTKAAVMANPYAEDMLLVAGVGEAVDKATEMGEVRAKTGLSYAVVSEGVEEMDTPFIAYIEKKGSKVGHVVTVTAFREGIVIYTGTNTNEKGEVIVEEEIKSMEEFKAEGFTGIVLAKAGLEGLSYLDKETTGVIEEVFKGLKSKKYEGGKEMMEEVINGVTSPKELSEALTYVLKIWGRSAEEMLEYIGLNKGDIGNKEAIVQASMDKMAQAIEMGKEGKISTAEVRVEIAIVTAMRDLLITASSQEKPADWIANTDFDTLMSKLVISRAVNQNVIVRGIERGLAGVTAADTEDFVIDVTKLQKAVRDRNLIFAKDAKIEDVMNLLKDTKTDKFRTPLMRLTDIRAVAAAA
jgi:hypothetical protein